MSKSLLISLLNTVCPWLLANMSKTLLISLPYCVCPRPCSDGYESEEEGEEEGKPLAQEELRARAVKGVRTHPVVVNSATR